MIRALGRALALVCLPLAGAAQEAFPALYRVVGVAAGDVLNVRAGPGAGHEVVAVLAPGAAPVEVVDFDFASGWLMVNAGGTGGFAAPRHLERLAGPGAGELPLPLYCGGTEPFWGIEIDAAGAATYSDPEAPGLTLALDHAGAAAARWGEELFATLSGEGASMQAVFQRRYCSDGMSDHAYGLKIDLIVQPGDGAPFMTTGCCALLR